MNFSSIRCSETGASADCGEVALARPVLSCFRSNDAGEVVFDCTLLLKNWRWKGVSTRERINILIHARERIHRTSQVLLSSTVCVNYFTASNDQQNSSRHSTTITTKPSGIIHCSTCRSLIDVLLCRPEDMSSLKYKCRRKRQHRYSVAREFQLADMTLASVVLCLAADHVGGGLFAEFWKKIVEFQKEMPHPNITSWA